MFPVTRSSVVLSVVMAACGGAAPAQDVWADTVFLDAYAGSPRSSLARALSAGGYELAGGGAVRFEDWYSPRFPDVTVLFLTQVTPDFAVIWGASSGERGEKYRIDPALHLGFVWRHALSSQAELWVRGVHPLFGRMREYPCTADYGAIGGVQQVNCRLAADPMPPEETLDYLIDLDARTEARLGIGVTLLF